jgi:hypothetical protein
LACTSACEIHREWIEGQVVLGRNAMSIYQDLVELLGFSHRYNSVKRFVNALKAREPERFDVLESLPGEEAQVDLRVRILAKFDTERFNKASPATNSNSLIYKNAFRFGNRASLRGKSRVIQKI